MSDYKPDRWVMLKLTHSGKTTYKILAGWSGSYLHGSSWKLNSGCVSVTEEDDYFVFSGYSGSVYRCHKKCYGMTGLTANVLSSFKTDAEENSIGLETLPEETNWMELDYE
jgi:hypothetical protein